MNRFLLLCCVVVSTAVAAQSQAPVVSDTMAAQVMLDRLGFSSGEIDGRVGSNVRGALNAFQRAKGLPITGELDSATWQRLKEESGAQPPLISYTLIEGDVAGQFTPDIPADLMEQSKLKALGYRNSLEALAEKFHANPDMLRRLNPGASFDRAGEEVNVPNVTVTEAPPAPEPAARGRGRGRGRGAAPVGTTGHPAVTIYVTKATSALTVEDQSGTVIFHAPVTSGSEHDPLPIGSWRSLEYSETRHFTTTRICSGMRTRHTRKPRFPLGRTTPSAFCGST
jgi:hypothetical protein